MKNFKDRDFLIENPDLIVLDVRYSMSDAEYGKKSYAASHYKGAHFLDMDQDLADVVGTHGGRHPLPDMKLFEEKLRSIGLENHSRVLIYDDGDNSSAGRLWWMLKYYGLSQVYVLQGGFKMLLPEDLTSDSSETKRGNITLTAHPDMTAPIEEITDYAKNGSVSGKLLIDSRSKERYQGLVEPVDHKKGHIPHALNIFFKDHFKEDQTFDLEKAKKNFHEILHVDDVIFHCGSGVTACTNIMALDELGKKSRLYVGSFSDYISYEDNVVERDV